MAELGPTAESSTPETNRKQPIANRRTPRSGDWAGRGGQRGRHNQGGYYGNSPQGMQHRGQHQQRNTGGGYQDGELHSSMPVGTKMQGYVESVKDKFGFIRVATAAESIFFHMSEFRAEGPGLSNGTSSAAQQPQQDASTAAPHLEEQPLPEALYDDSAPPGLEPAPDRQTGQRKPALSRDLTELVQPGQPVEFSVSASSYDKVKNKGGRPPKYVARQVRMLPEGEIQMPESSEKPIQGRIEKPLAGSSNSSWTNRETATAGGLISCQKPATDATEERQQLFVPFSETDLKMRGLRFNRGDSVDFVLGSDLKSGRQTASQISPAKQARPFHEPAGPREQGFVARYSETFGFIRSLDRDIHQQLFFHRSEVQMEPGQAITPGAEVSFSLAPDTQGKGEGNPMAVHVQLLPEGILEAEKRLPERVKGQVTRQCVQKEKTDQGKLAYEDEQGSTRICNFSLDQVQDGEETGRALDTGDQAEFSVTINRKLGTAVAEGVKLICKAEDKRELGQVKQLHGKSDDTWGFIRPCERSGDLFFHGSQLTDIAFSDLKTGDDVEFCVARDPTPDQPKRIVATRITRAPKGSAAFDVTSEQEYHGVVLDRMVKSKHTVSSGLLHYEDNSTPAKLTFGPRDLLDQIVNPKAQDHVTFRTCINPRAVKAAERVGGAAAQYAGRRATQVALTMHSGKVQYVSRAHGFLDWQINGEGQPRIFFQAFDVEGNVELCKGDEVTFNIADKMPRKEAEKAGITDIPIIARRVHRTKEAAVKDDGPAPAERNPAAVKYSGNLGQAPGAPKGVRIARGPDGSNGFAPGRGRPVPQQAAACTPQPAPGSAPGLKTTLSSGSLNPTAAEFVPGGFSAAESAPVAPSALPAALAAKITAVNEQLRNPKAASAEPAKISKASATPPQQDYRILEKQKVAEGADHQSSDTEAEQTQAHIPGQAEPDQALAAENGKHSQEEEAKAVGEKSVPQQPKEESSSVADTGSSKPAREKTAEGTATHSAAMQPEGAEPNEDMSKAKQEHVAERADDTPISTEAGAVTGIQEHFSPAAALSAIAQTLEGIHIDSDKGPAKSAAPADNPSTEKHTEVAEMKESEGIDGRYAAELQSQIAAENLQNIESETAEASAEGNKAAKQTSGAAESFKDNVAEMKGHEGIDKATAAKVQAQIAAENIQNITIETTEGAAVGNKAAEETSGAAASPKVTDV